MTGAGSTRTTWRDFLPAISLALVLATAILTGGGLIGQLRENSRRIQQLETDARTDAKTRTEMLQQLDLRLARIEVKLEMMAEPRGKAP